MYLALQVTGAVLTSPSRSGAGKVLAASPVHPRLADASSDPGSMAVASSMAQPSETDGMV